jgi:hypothetical protein
MPSVFFLAILVSPTPEYDISIVRCSRPAQNRNDYDCGEGPASHPKKPQKSKAEGLKEGNITRRVGVVDAPECSQSFKFQSLAI